MTVKTAISLRPPLLNRIDASAKELGVSRSAFLAAAAEELIQKLENRKLLSQLDEAYADAPDQEERELQERMRDLQRRQIEPY
jgi:metal-responsive CopG/Arc/MetJ family transcriptional regulator